jgi:hypothetical protein
MIQITTSTERKTGGETTDNPHNSSLELTSAAQPIRGDSDWQPWRTSAAQRHSLYSAARFAETRVWAFEGFLDFFTEPEVTLVGPPGWDDWWCYGAELAMGLLTTKDPIGFAGGLNWYVYVGNDPVNHIDPSGLQMSAEKVCLAAWQSGNVGGIYCYRYSNGDVDFYACGGPSVARPGQEHGQCPEVENACAEYEGEAHLASHTICSSEPGIHGAQAASQQFDIGIREECIYGPSLISEFEEICPEAMALATPCEQYACQSVAYNMSRLSWVCPELGYSLPWDSSDIEWWAFWVGYIFGFSVPLVW